MICKAPIVRCTSNAFWKLYQIARESSPRVATRSGRHIRNLIKWLPLRNSYGARTRAPFPRLQTLDLSLQMLRQQQRPRAPYVEPFMGIIVIYDRLDDKAEKKNKNSASPWQILVAIMVYPNRHSVPRYESELPK